MRFPSSLRRRPRSICVSVGLLVVMLCAHVAKAQTALMNGTNQAGTLLVNTTNSYTLTANTGDNIVLRLGSTGFEGNLRLYGPPTAVRRA